MNYREDPGYSADQYFRQNPRTPPVLKTLIIVTIAVFAVQMAIRGFGGINAIQWFDTTFGVYYPKAILQLHVWQFITYAFLHDTGDARHVLFNMLILWFAGREIAALYGRKRFLTFYLIAAAVSGLLYLGFDAARVMSGSGVGRHIPCIGASGAVFAVIMAYGLYWPNREILFMFVFRMRVRTLVVIMIIAQIWGLFGKDNTVAHSAHLGGLLWGYLFVRYGGAMERKWHQITSRYGLRAKRRGPASEPRGPASGPRGPASGDDSRSSSGGSSEADTRRLDAILDKIHRQGIQSLTWREQRFLKSLGEKK